MNQLMNAMAAKATTMSFKAKRAVRKQLEGQTLVEYVLIIALLSLAAIAVITLCGGQIKSAFTTVTDTISGAIASGKTA